MVGKIYEVFFALFPDKVFDKFCRLIYNKRQTSGTAVIKEKLQYWKRGKFL